MGSAIWKLHVGPSLALYNLIHDQRCECPGLCLKGSCSFFPPCCSMVSPRGSMTLASAWFEVWTWERMVLKHWTYTCPHKVFLPVLKNKGTPMVWRAVIVLNRLNFKSTVFVYLNTCKMCYEIMWFCSAYFIVLYTILHQVRECWLVQAYFNPVQFKSITHVLLLWHLFHVSVYICDGKLLSKLSVCHCPWTHHRARS